MTADIYLHEQANFNKWLKELTGNEYAHFLYMLEEYASQQRTEGIKQGFEAAREVESECKVWNCEGNVRKYPTVDDYLNSKK